MNSYETLRNRVPELLKVLEQDNALSNMLLDMINNNKLNLKFT